MSGRSFRSPFAALVWKEWRESWWLLVLTLVWPAASYSTASFCTLTTSVWDESAIIGLILLALSLGAGLFAGERAKGTSAFIAERAVRRSMIWHAKIIMPVLTLAAAVILYGIVSCCLLPIPRYKGISPDMCIMPLLAFLMFAWAVLCSALLDRTVTAWAAGGVLSLVTLIGQGGLFDHFMGLDAERFNLQWSLFLCLVVIESIGLLWLSRVAYVRWMHD